MIDQFMIAACGITAVYLSQDPRPHWAKWACIAGLAGEPFWFWAAWKADQWGIMVLVFVYAAGWSRGLWHHWLKKMNRDERQAR